jgi:hypothetical protein
MEGKDSDTICQLRNAYRYPFALTLLCSTADRGMNRAALGQHYICPPHMTSHDNLEPILPSATIMMTSVTTMDERACNETIGSLQGTPH